MFDQDIFIRPIEDALSVVWDRFSVDPTGRDARRCFVSDKMPKKEYKAKFGDIPEDRLYNQDTLNELAVEGWVDQDCYQVSEYWRLIERKRLMALFSNGKTFILDDNNSEELMDLYGAPVKTRVTWAASFIKRTRP